MIIWNHDEVRFENVDGLIPQRFDEYMISHERQRRFVDIVARLRFEMSIDSVRQLDDVSSRKVGEGCVESATSTGKDDGVPGDALDSFDESRFGGLRNRRKSVRRVVGVGEGGEWSERLPLSTAISGAATSVGGEADERRETIDRADVQIFDRPLVRFSS